MVFSDSPSKLLSDKHWPRPGPCVGSDSGSDRTLDTGHWRTGPGLGRHVAFWAWLFLSVSDYNMLAARIALSRWKLLSHTEMISCMRQDWCPCLAVKICIKGISKVLTICQELMIKGLLLRFIYTLTLLTEMEEVLSLSFHCISGHLSD